MLWDKSTVKVIATQISHNLSSYWGTLLGLFMWFFFMCPLHHLNTVFTSFSSHLPGYCFLFIPYFLKTCLFYEAQKDLPMNHSFLNATWHSQPFSFMPRTFPEWPNYILSYQTVYLHSITFWSYSSGIIGYISPTST